MKTTTETLITRMFGMILEPFAKWQKLKSFSVIKIKITEWKDRDIWKSFSRFCFFKLYLKWELPNLDDMKIHRIINAISTEPL